MAEWWVDGSGALQRAIGKLPWIFDCAPMAEGRFEAAKSSARAAGWRQVASTSEWTALLPRGDAVAVFEEETPLWRRFWRKRRHLIITGYRV